MHYYFVDDTQFRPRPTGTFFGVGVVVVPQDSFRREIDLARKVYSAKAPGSLMPAVSDVLERTGGVGMVCTCEFPTGKVYAPQRRDSIGPGRTISRQVLVSSLATGLAIALAVRTLAQEVDVGKGDVFLDNQSLNDRDMDDFSTMLRKQLVDEAKQRFGQSGLRDLRRFRVGRIQWVEKWQPGRGQLATWQQAGVQCADRLCAAMTKHPEACAPRVGRFDLTQNVSDLIASVEAPGFGDRFANR